MIKKEELLEMAREAGAQDFAGGTCVISISQLSEFANAILERAAVECERSEMYRGSIFAARIRKLKEPQ